MEIHQFLWTHLWPPKMEKNNSMNHGNLPPFSPHFSPGGIMKPTIISEEKWPFFVTIFMNQAPAKKHQTNPLPLQTCKSSSPFTAATSVIPRIGWNPVIKTTWRIMVQRPPFLRFQTVGFLKPMYLNPTDWWPSITPMLVGMLFSHGFF